MAHYAILLTGDEDAWERLTPEEQQQTFELHETFAEQLAARGHEITGGAQLEPTATATTIRPGDDRHIVTQGPYTESVEQLGAFYLVSSDDEADLIEAVAILTRDGTRIEVRRLVDEPAE